MNSLLNKRIAIYGAGAVGCYFGWLLAEAGYDAEFIGRSSRLNAFLSSGLSVKKAGREPLHINIKASGELKGLYDVILICVKSKDTLAAAQAVKNHLSESGFAVSLQNGINNADIIGSVLGSNKVIPSVVYLTASMDVPGELLYQSAGKLIYGYYDESGKENAEVFFSILEKTRIKHELSRDIRKDQWIKLCLNAPMNPLSALFQVKYGKMTQDKDALYLAKAIFDEVREAAGYCGVSIGEDEFNIIKDQCSRNPEFKSSMLQDLERGRNPETEAILGAVSEAFRREGKIAPYSDMLLRIMNVMYGEGHWFQLSPKLTADVLVERGDEILLIERKNEPFGWAIPGGFVDLYEKTEVAAARELYEETGIKAPVKELELLGIYSDPARDYRGHNVSSVYVYRGGGTPRAGDDAKNAQYFTIGNLPSEIAFDHRKIIGDYVKKYKK